MPASPRQENPFLRKSSANSYCSWVDVGIDPYEPYWEISKIP
ncbi:hypothetical protein [Oscillospiraceae bacterium]|nr:hypothetical protein [Oscillospiraceae bacterium]